jgi:hypothetical protein
MTVFNVTPNALVPLGLTNPIRDIWLPLIFSDPLLFQSTIFTTSVHLSAYQPLGYDEVGQFKGETLALLNRRLADPREAVTDITIATVLGFIHESIVSGNVEDTKTHMDGLEKMLATAKSDLNPLIQEILFWTDLFGSAFAHTPFRGYSARPPTAVTRLHCLPIFLYPSTLASLCLGFQQLLFEPIFESLIDPLHEIRCLTIAFHFSSYKARNELPIFAKMCYTVTSRLGHVSNPLFSPIFEACRIASMLFVDLILLADATDAAPRAKELRIALQQLSLREASPQIWRLVLWITFFGSAATLERELGSWFLKFFMSAVINQGLRSFRDMRSVLLEFFWIDDICDTILISILKKQISTMLPDESYVS